jgi:hypothetical protein
MKEFLYSFGLGHNVTIVLVGLMIMILLFLLENSLEKVVEKSEAISYDGSRETGFLVTVGTLFLLTVIFG